MQTLALSQMSPTWQAIFYALAFLAFLAAAANVNARVGLLGLGLALFTFVYLWQAVAAA